MNHAHQNIGRTLRISAVSSFIARGFQLLSAVITIPLIVHAFDGAAGYGIWVTITAAFALLGLADLGIASGLARLIARSKGKRQPIGNLLKTMLFVEVTAAFVVLLLTFVLAYFLPSELGFSSEDNALVGQAILIMGCATALSMPLRLGIPVLTGHQCYGLHLIGDTLKSILSLLGIVGISYWSSLDYRSLAAVSGAAMLIGSYTGFLLAQKVSDPWYLFKSKADKRLLRIGLDLGWASLVVTASVTISLQGTTLALGIYGDPAWAGIWALAIFVVTQVSHLGASLTAPITTLAAQLEAQRNAEHLKSTLKNVSLFIAAIVSLLAVAAAIFGPSFVVFMLPTVDEAGQSVVLIGVLTSLLIALALTLPVIPMRSFLLGTRKHWSVARWNFASSIAGVVALFVTIPVLQIWGAVLSRWVFVIIPAIGLYAPVMRAMLGNNGRYFLMMFIGILLWPAFSGWIVWMLGLTYHTSYIDFFLGIIIYLLLSLTGTLFLIPDFRASLKRFIHSSD